jgi:DNA-binding beta-propeller fold protein YncE
LSSSGAIAIVSGKTQTAIAPLLTGGQLGTVGGGLFDVVISPDGKTTLVSNFGDSKVFFIDTTYPAIPSVAGSVEIGFFAEDMAMTPDGRYALVADGGFSPKIAVLDVANRSLVGVFEDTAGHYFNSVDIAKDGVTVLAADYFAAKVHVLRLGMNGHLSYASSIDVSRAHGLRPVNVTISPDGYTAIAACVGDNEHPEYMGFPVLTIEEPGKAILTDWVSPSINIIGAQSVAFSRDGTKAYVSCVQYMPPVKKSVSEEEPIDPNNVIITLDVTVPGNATLFGKPVEVDFIGRSQLFGVDTLAVDYETGYLWVSNMTLSGGKNHVQAVDMKTGTVIKTISFAPILNNYAEEGEEPIWKEDVSIPAGVTFWNPSRH